MDDAVLLAAGAVIFAVTTTATLLFGYVRMQAAYERQVEDAAVVDVAAEERRAAPVTDEDGADLAAEDDGADLAAEERSRPLG